MEESRGRTALIIGGTGQIGSATARRLAESGWSVLLIHRGSNRGDLSLADLDVTTLRMDRDVTRDLVEVARGNDLVVDTIAFNPRHADQLAQLAGEVGSVVVISTASVYQGTDGGYLDVATGPDDFPHFPVPLRETDPTIDNDEVTYSPLKAAMERRLLDVDDLPVSILRPGAIHGPFSPRLREWYFIKRVRDRREKVALSDNGVNRFATSATANIAELVRLCGEKPGKRVLNAVDEENLSVADIAQLIAEAMHRELTVVPFEGPPVDGVGETPWSVTHPMVLSMDAAKVELGYQQPVSYADAVVDDIRWIGGVVGVAERRQETWRDALPQLAEAADEGAWFNYEAEDEFVRKRGLR
jgi:nucleoside-diphosphate-sugar epimerase